MNLTFNICDIGNRYIRIQDITREGEEYIPEDLPENHYSSQRYFNYKYSQTCTINILQYNGTQESKIDQVIFTKHEGYLDEVETPISKDGYYTIYHIVLPTMEWLESKLQNPEFDLSVYQGLYITDGMKVFKMVGMDLIQCDPFEITQINTYNTTISRCQKDIFHFYDLYNCFIKLSNNIFNNSIIRCPDKNQEDARYNRDFIWSAINVMKLYIETDQYESAQLLLEKLDSCNGICKNTTYNGKVPSCGCS